MTDAPLTPSQRGPITNFGRAVRTNAAVRVLSPVAATSIVQSSSASCPVTPASAQVCRADVRFAASRSVSRSGLRVTAVGCGRPSAWKSDSVGRDPRALGEGVQIGECLDRFQRHAAAQDDRLIGARRADKKPAGFAHVRSGSRDSP